MTVSHNQQGKTMVHIHAVIGTTSPKICEELNQKRFSGLTNTLSDFNNLKEQL